MGAQWKPESIPTAQLTRAAKVVTAKPGNECLEAQLLGRLRQDSKVKGSLSSSGRPYLKMELLKGGLDVAQWQRAAY